MRVHRQHPGTLFHNAAFTNRIAGLLTAAVIAIFLAPSVYGAYVWHGAGVDGGTGTNRWEDANNWLDGGEVPDNPPGVNDDVSIAFNATNVVPAVLLPNGALARHVTLGGTTTVKANNRYLSFAGDAEFATLDYLGGDRTYAWDIKEGSTLTLSGGDVTTPTFKHLATCTLFNYTTIFADGLVTITADPAYIRLGATLPSSFVERHFSLVGAKFLFSGMATLDFNNRLLGAASGGRLEFNSAPTISNPPPMLRLRGGSVVGAAATPIVFDDTHLWLVDRTDTGSTGNARFRSLNVSNHGSSSGNQSLSALGDIKVSGYDVFTGYGHSVTGAVFISRLERVDGLGDYSRLLMNGHNLTVTSAYPVVIGHPYTPGNNLHDYRPRSILDLRGSGGASGALTAAGGLWVGFNGNIAGNANSVIHIGRDFHIRLHRLKHTTSGGNQYTGYNLASSTVIMNGKAGRREPQLLEAHGEDLGPTLAGQVASNLAIGRLEIGTPEQATHVRLVDLADFKEDEEPDALYVGELEVHADSTLDICGLNLYVNGESVFRRWRDFGDGLVIDSTIPSGTLLLVQ